MADLQNKASARDQLVFAEQIAMIYRLTLHSLGMSFIGSTVVALALWPRAPHVSVIAWYLFHHVVTVGRYLLIRAYQRTKPSPATKGPALFGKARERPLKGMEVTPPPKYGQL